MRIYRNEIVASSLSLVVSAEEFSRRNFGWTRLEVAHKFLDDLGLTVEGDHTMQVIQANKTVTIRILDA